MPDHHPPHIHQDKAWYIITSATLGRVRLLSGSDGRAIVRDRLQSLVPRFGITLLAWVILDNHYHLLLRTPCAPSLADFIRRLHGSTARQLNLRGSQVGRQVWHNYWDSCVRSQYDLWTRFNYIHQNPVKHGYVSRPEDWPFSSYGYYLRTKGVEWLEDCWERYRVVDFLAGDDL